jgi:hypothetical protein
LTNGLIPIEKLKKLIDDLNVPFRDVKKMIRKKENIFAWHLLFCSFSSLLALDLGS